MNRKSKTVENEIIYGAKAFFFLLRENVLSRFLRWLIGRFSFCSSLYGWLQNRKNSRKKIASFVENFHVDLSEFEKSIEEFDSFNDFFIRKLKPNIRSIHPDSNVAIMPADGRYLVFPNIQQADGFWVKGQKFDLTTLLNSKELAQKYEKGSLAMIRLAPPDYHRFHFPFDCTPSEAALLNGSLYSVNPLFLKKRISILSENKRMLTKLRSDVFGEILMIEVGATNVGTIHQTYTPNRPVKKGQEKGFFSFGGSCILLLFEEGKVVFDQDLIDASRQPIEVRSIFGDSLATRK